MNPVHFDVMGRTYTVRYVLEIRDGAGRYRHKADYMEAVGIR